MLSEMLQEYTPPDSVAATPSQVTPEAPDNASVTVLVTVAVEVEKDVPSAGEVTESTGIVLSRLMVTLAVAVSPAVSVTVPLTI
jgi:hypothetical protein